MTVLDIPQFELPAPSAILRHIASDPEFYITNARVTLWEAFLGFWLGLFGALAVATVMAHSRFVEQAVTPLAVLVQVTPLIAYAPALVIWLGFGLKPILVGTALVCFVPFLFNAVVGFRSIDPATHELLRSVDASKREVFVRLRVPHALPYLFSAARIAVGLALIGAVLTEFFAGVTQRARLRRQAGAVVQPDAAALGLDLRPRLPRRRRHVAHRRARAGGAALAQLAGRRQSMMSAPDPGGPMTNRSRRLAARRRRRRRPRAAGRVRQRQHLARRERHHRAPAAPPRRQPATTATGSAAATTTTAPGVTAAGISPERCAANKAAGAITYLSSFDFAAAASILDVVVAKERGYFDDMCLERARSSPASPRPTTRSSPAGRRQLSSAGSYTEILNYSKDGAKFVAVTDYGKTPIEALVVPGDVAITTLQDLKGKTIGVKGDIPPSIVAMLSQAGLQRGKDYKEVLLDGFDPVAQLKTEHRRPARLQVERARPARPRRREVPAVRPGRLRHPRARSA